MEIQELRSKMALGGTKFQKMNPDRAGDIPKRGLRLPICEKLELELNKVEGGLAEAKT